MFFHRKGSAALLLALSFCTAAFAVDDRTVTSPDGRLAFHLSVASQDGSVLSRIAYSVSLQGKPLIDLSYLGLEIENQEPLLGEKAGLITAKTGSAAHYHWLIADFMQDGSIGSRITVEVRAYNEGLAFRYLLPLQTPLKELLIDDEVTEFRFPRKVDTPATVPLPLLIPEPGIGWLAIAEVRPPSFPAASLAHLSPSALITRLAQPAGDPKIAYQGKTPWTGPWRILLLGADKTALLHSHILKDVDNIRP